MIQMNSSYMYVYLYLYICIFLFIHIYLFQPFEKLQVETRFEDGDVHYTNESLIRGEIKDPVITPVHPLKIKRQVNISTSFLSIVSSSQLN